VDTLITVRFASTILSPHRPIQYTLGHQYPKPDSRICIRPVHASTPTRAKHKAAKSNHRLRIINVNCQSVKNKQCRIQNLIDSTKPDIIIATETWLDPTITNSQFLPPNFTVYRNDRNTDGGGVLIAIDNKYISEPAPD
jgi:hypothetical protein